MYPILLSGKCYSSQYNQGGCHASQKIFYKNGKQIINYLLSVKPINYTYTTN
jgi:hypothetical protein